jgi:hypothetical protein
LQPTTEKNSKEGLSLLPSILLLIIRITTRPLAAPALVARAPHHAQQLLRACRDLSCLSVCGSIASLGVPELLNQRKRKKRRTKPAPLLVVPERR